MFLYLFEAAIYIWLTLSAYFAYKFLRAIFSSKEDKKILKLIISIILIIGWFVVFYGSFIEPRIVVANDHDIFLNKNNSNRIIKVAAVSDMHFGPFKRNGFSQRVADKIKEQDPDIIVLLGDYIYGSEENHKYLKPILELSKLYPIYVITGNHEYYLDRYKAEKIRDKTGYLRNLLAEYDVPLLENENKLITINQNQFYLVGVKEYWTGEADLNKALTKVPPSMPKILLCHNPEFISEAQDRVDLMLSGHTHGGQIRLPWLGPVPTLPTSLGRHYDKGIFEFGRTTLFITPGAGEIGPRARLFNPPEVSILNINL